MRLENIGRGHSISARKSLAHVQSPQNACIFRCRQGTTIQYSSQPKLSTGSLPSLLKLTLRARSWTTSTIVCALAQFPTPGCSPGPLFTMSRRKRGHDEMEASEPPKETSLLEKLRNMWEFASLNQYIYTFGDAVKIDKDLDIEVPLIWSLHTPVAHFSLSTELLWRSVLLIKLPQELETECLKPGPSDKLEEIGLTLLKWISSHRGLT